MKNIYYIPLNEVTETIIDHRGKTATKLGGEWKEKGIPVLSANNVKANKFVEMDNLKYITQELYGKWMPIKLKKGDVFLVSEGATFGELLY